VGGKLDVLQADGQVGLNAEPVFPVGDQLDLALDPGPARRRPLAEDDADRQRLGPPGRE
jgi:hypothetical protein